MAQFPLKLSSSPISPHCTPRPSTDDDISLSSSPRRSSSIDKKAIRSILLRIFRPPKGNCGASPISSKRFKLIACFSSSKRHPATVESDGGQQQQQINRDSITSSSDPTRTESDDYTSSYDGLEIKAEDEEIKCVDDYNDLEGISTDTDTVNSSTIVDCSSEEDAMNAKDLKIVLKHCSSVRKDSQNVATSSAPGVVLFVAKLLKAMKHSGGRFSMSLSCKNSKRKGDDMVVSGKHKIKKTSLGSSNRYQIWTKPILMGKRCRQFDDGFPYSNDYQVAGDESMVVDDHHSVSVFSAFSSA